MIVRTLLFFLSIIVVYPLQAQRYNTGIGVRFGNNHYGATIKQRILGKTTLEGLVIIDPLQYNGTILVQQHFPVVGRGLNLYLGPGVHMGEQKETGKFYGVDFVLGAELKIPALPLVVSADVKPAYHLDHGEWFDFSTALSLHYIIGKDTKNKRDREKRKKNRLKEKEKKANQKAREKKKREKEREKEKGNEDKSFWNFDFLKRDKSDSNN